MRQLFNIFIFMLLCASKSCAQSNQVKTPGVSYCGAGGPNWTPVEKTASEIAIDTSTGYFWQWHRTPGPTQLGSWIRIAQGIDVTTGGTPPAYAPFRNQSWFAINGSNELYHYSGSGTTWNLVCGGGGGATDIGYTDNGGNSVDITSSTGAGFNIVGYNGMQVYEDSPGVVAFDGAGLGSKWTDAGTYTYLTATGDNVAIGSSATAAGRLHVKGSGATSATNAAVFDKSSGTRIMTVRNDGRVGIGTSSPGATLESVNNAAEQLRLSYTAGSQFQNIQVLSNGNTFFENTGGSYLFGTGGTEAGELFSLSKTFSGSGAAYGLNTNFVFDPSTDISAGLYGHQFRARFLGSKTNGNCASFFARTTVSNTGSSSYKSFRAYIETTGSANAQTLIGAEFGFSHDATGTITDLIGHDVEIFSNNGTITNTYGVYIGDITIGTQTNTPYSIYASDANARSYFAGKFIHDATNTATGTTGNRTINKPSGTVNIAAGGTSVTVTNSLVTTSSIIIPVIRTNDATAQILSVVPAAGSFTINITACTGEVSIGFVCYN